MESDWFANRNPVYLWLMLGGIALSGHYWRRKMRAAPLTGFIYMGALGGAFAGAKLAYLFAEGWLDWSRPDRWLAIATGKSVVGGLLGGYAGVEIAKQLVGYRKSTGDTFVLILPLSLALGRVGCWFNGCCTGLPIDTPWGHLVWPAQMVEVCFQLLTFAALLLLNRRGKHRDRLFYLFLIAYGSFRFAHEFLRDTPKAMFGISGYQWLSLLMCGLGIWDYRRRSRQMVTTMPDDQCVSV